ncbi:D-alanyl-D-alanine carboxypeptidase family protein [Microbacterium thalli]|uniref:D-alanyl-D-alanine carboxypeptidase family protein n=1 Tax=Microbacterium thalli TaxID=3027921 RepID=A0ABT5SHM8_9MICO|nr:D-alanyl-D-alanine carboxypeptidase family protein [Microbacterium thalli]MDD7961696.1 D-alanyl-D-alanine carboxypeptidase family protein [Microbacterium thalli]
MSTSSAPSSRRPAPFDSARRATFVAPRTNRSRPSRRVRRRRLAVAAVAATGVVALAAGLMGVFPSVSGSSLPSLPSVLPGTAFSPSADDGFIGDGAGVDLADDDLPAIARLDPELLAAMRAAEADAAGDGIRFQVTGGWRSAAYQQWLLDTRIAEVGEETARAYVATPEQSRHVNGDAVDIGPVDAQYWLISYGSDYGICQTYANEPWHFELATEPGRACPDMRTDATG